MSNRHEMSTTEPMEPENLANGRTQSLRGSLTRAWSSKLQPQATEERANKSRASMFVSKRMLMTEEVMLDIDDMADFEEADEVERDDFESRPFVVEEEECDVGGGVTDERTPKMVDEVEGDITTSTQSIGSHLLTRNMFVLEVTSNRSIRFAIYIVYGVFVASIVLEFLFAFNDSGYFLTIAVRPVNADGSFCYPHPNGTCEAFNEISSAEAILLTNTGVVSSGLNVSDWEGTGASPGAPPFSAIQVEGGLFIADPSILEYSANPQLHQYWEDIAAVIWTGYSGGSTGYYRVVYVDMKFERTDGMDWPAEIADEPFPVRIEGYACLRGKNCTNIGDWRLMVVDDEVSLYPVRSVRGNEYQARITVYSHYLGEAVIGSLAWRFVILADPGGAVSESLMVDDNTTAVIAKINLSGDPDIPHVVAIVDIVVLAVYVAFILWWSYTLRKRSGPFVLWATENKWLLINAVGFILSVNPIVVGLQLNLSGNNDAGFNEQWWAAAMIVSGFGQSLNYFVFACWADAPRRYVTKTLRFYGGKAAFCTIFFITWALAQVYRFPSTCGWDEPGTASQLGGHGYITAPENWTRRKQSALSWLMIILIVELIFVFFYYAWALVRSRKVLKDLPYSMTRPIQLSSRFFFWLTSLWVLVEFVLVIYSIVKVIHQDQDYFVHMDSRSRLVVALDSMYFLDGGFNSIYNQVFGVVFLIIFQCFFLPPDAFGGFIQKEKTHYVAEEEADHDGIQGQPKYLMVLEIARFLLVCSREVYLPFDEEERKMREPSVKKASSNAKLDVKKSASKDIRKAKETLWVTQTGSSKLSDEGENSLSAKDLGNELLSVVQSESPSDAAEPKAPEERLDSTNDLSVVQSESSSEGAELEAPTTRIAGESGGSPGFLPWESTLAMGCTVVARLSEPEGADMHNTRALILRHMESGDLIVSFRGTLTKKQVQTDLMSTKVLVDLDTFLTSKPKRCRDMRNVRDVQDEIGRVSPDVVEDKIRSGEITKIRLMDLLPKQEDDELPDYLTTSTKVTDGIDGLCKLHFGFWSSYSRIRRQVHLTVREELLALPGRLLITGHSLGGAQATICAYDLSRWVLLTVRKELLKTKGRAMADKIEMMCYNYGSPRVGNKAFQLAYNKVVPNAQRIVHDGDVVTGVPPARLGFRHIGRENIFDRVGSIRVDPSLIEQHFTTQKTAVNPHMCSSYRAVVEKSFNPVMSEAQLLDLIRTAYGYKG